MWYYRRWEKSVPEEVHHVGAEMMTSASKHVPSFRPTERHESWPMGFIHLLWRFPKAPWHHVGSFPGMTLCSQDGPESFNACRFDGRKWRVSVTLSAIQTSFVSRSWPSMNSRIGSSWERSINCGNQDSAGHSCAIKITFTPGDWTIFCSTWGTILNGGNAHRRPISLSQGMDMASVYSALGSGYDDTNLTSRLLANVPNKSIRGSPHLANTGRRLSMAIVHSLVSIWPTLDRESAWMLCTPGRWTGTNVIALLSHHLSSRMVICIKVCEFVPPSFLMYATVTALSHINRTTRDLRWGMKSFTA